MQENVETMHCGLEHARIWTVVLGHSLIRLLVRSHCSLIHLLRTTRFACALRCAQSFACLLTLLTPLLMGKRFFLYEMNGSPAYSFNPLCSDVQFKIFLTKLKGLPNLFVRGKIFTANIEIRKKILKEQRINSLTGEFLLQACSLEPYLTVF